MTKKITNEATKPTPKVKIPKVKLVSYSVRATIPTGAYANICPEIVVQAVSIEAAERAVMPHIEAMFAKYREGSTTHLPTPVNHVVNTAPQSVVIEVNGGNRDVHMSRPFNRAQSAIDNATSMEAIDLLQSQIEKSVKLVESEKTELLKSLLIKAMELKNVTSQTTPIV